MMTSYIKELADSLKKKFNSNNPFIIAKGLNINVKIKEMPALKGFYTINQRNRFIIVNSKLNATMIKIVLAHELGHDQLHRGIMDFFTEANIYTLTNQTEFEANMFAAELLVDDQEVINVLKAGYDFFTTAKMLYIDKNLLSIKLQAMNNRGYELNIPIEYKRGFL